MRVIYAKGEVDMIRPRGDEIMSLNSSKSGFTIVELSLSLAFISILSITVVLVITGALASYRRGITLNQVNTVGMELVDDIRGAIQNSPAHSLVEECTRVYTSSSLVDQCESDKARAFATVMKRGNVKIAGTVPLSGAFCTGKYSYIWNSGYLFNGMSTQKPVSLKYKKSGENSEIIKKDFKLLKLEDGERNVCISAASTGNSYSQSSSNFDISKYGALEKDPIELLDGYNNLALYNLEPTAIAEGENQNSIFYSVSFILGTRDGGININASGNYCSTSGGANSAVENFDNCAINKFNFAAQATGGLE